MTDVTAMGITNSGEIYTSTVKGQINTTDDDGQHRSLAIGASNDTGTESVYFNLHSVDGNVPTSRYEMNYSLPTIIKNLAAPVDDADLANKAYIDNIIDNQYVVNPLRVEIPMNIGWGPVGGGNEYKTVLDEGLFFNHGAAPNVKGLVIVNKPIPTAAGTKVYFEFEVVYHRDNGSGTKLNFASTFAVGIITETAWDSVPINDYWGYEIGAENGCGFLNQPVMFDTNEITVWTSTDPIYTNYNIETNSPALLHSYYDTSNQSFFNPGLKVQVAYDVDGDNIEIVMTDGPDGDGDAHGIRFRALMPNFTNGTFNNPVEPSYFAISPTPWGVTDDSLSQARLKLSDVGIGYYKGAMADVKQLS